MEPARLVGVVADVALQRQHRLVRLPGAVVQAGQGLGHLAVVWPHLLHLQEATIWGEHGGGVGAGAE